MQDVLTYEAWLDVVCYICNSLLKANVSIVGAEFKVVASKYKWVIFIDSERIHHAYDEVRDPKVGATELMWIIVDEWDNLLIKGDD